MINNRQAGRRNRGRNNNGRPNGQNRGGGDSGNRIDSRARGNATQLLEKYRNLARDAQLSGDRVNVEYYLQFADHYFRVLADNRARQEEQSPQRFRQQQDSFEDHGDEFGGDEFGSDFAQPQGQFQPREQRAYRSDRSEEDGQGGRGRNGTIRDRDFDRAPREAAFRPEAPESLAEPVQAERRDVEVQQAVVDAPEGATARRRRGRPPKAVVERDAGEGLLADVLPPSISRNDAGDAGAGEADAAPAPRKRGRPRRATAEAAE